MMPPRSSPESSPNRNNLPSLRADEPDNTAGPEAGPTLYAARQPILDRQANVYGYELLFRSGPENRYTATDADWASAVSIEQSATVFGLDQLVGNRRAFVNLSRGALLSEYHRLLPRERVVVELLEDIAPDAEALAACQRVRDDGYLLALDDYAATPESEPFLDIVHMVKSDLRRWPLALNRPSLAPLRARGLKLVAEKVETHEEAQAALAAGYDLLQGYFYCRPEMVAVRDLPPSKLSVLRFVAETSSAETSIERIEDLFRADVGLTVRLLRYLNSASFGWRHEVESIRHALDLLGERPLRRWAVMLAMMSLCEDRPHELLVTALSRARFAQRIGTPSGLDDCDDELFLAGMLTLVDTMVGRPTREIMDGLAISDCVRDAVLEHRAPLGPVLDVVTAYERGDWPMLDEMLKRCPVPNRALDEAYVDSLAWAEAIVM
jgi:EAL and modified HD-GYP domain-containing signal transduction protein